VLLAVLVPAVVRWRAPSPATPSTAPSIAGVETLPAAQRQQVEAALREGVAPPPSYLAGLGGDPEALMGASPRSSFHLVEPLATAVVSDRPTFRWEPLADAERYLVSISDEALHPIAVSAPLSDTSWAPDPPLVRGRTYLWQVTARRGAESVTAPAPPAPLAKIRVLDAETARVLEQTAATHPGSHLLLGILYAQAGARREAETQLTQVPSTDPYYAVAQRTLERIRSPAAVAR
jgi:hypothetical protein